MPRVEALESRLAPATLGPQLPGLMLPSDSVPPGLSVSSGDPTEPGSIQIDNNLPSSPGAGDSNPVPPDIDSQIRPTAPGEVVTRDHFDRAFEDLGNEETPKPAPMYDGTLEGFFNETLPNAMALQLTRMVLVQEAPVPLQAVMAALEEELGYGPKGVGGTEEPVPLPTMVTLVPPSVEPPLAQPASTPRAADVNGATVEEQEQPTMPPSSQEEDIAPPSQPMENEALVEPMLEMATDAAPSPLLASVSLCFLPFSLRKSKKQGRGRGQSASVRNKPVRGHDRTRSPPRLQRQQRCKRRVGPRSRPVFLRG